MLGLDIPLDCGLEAFLFAAASSFNAFTIDLR
jgi:hypothetical protein